MIRLIVFFVLGSFVSTVVQASSPPELPPPAMKKIDFSADIAPIIEKHCIKCHGPKKQKSLYRMDSREDAIGSGSEKSAILPGNSAESLIVTLISGIDPDYMMMPPKGDPLSAEEVALVRAWIDQGVPWEAPAIPSVDPGPGVAGEWYAASTSPKSNAVDWAFPSKIKGTPEIWAEHKAGSDSAGNEGVLLWDKDARFYQGRLSARFQALEEDGKAGGGLIWQVSDEANYLLAEYDAHEGLLQLIQVEEGERRALAGAEVQMSPADWYQLEVGRMGSQIDVRLNGGLYLTAEVNSSGGGGGAGLWSPAGRAMRFTLPEIASD